MEVASLRNPEGKKVIMKIIIKKKS